MHKRYRTVIERRKSNMKRYYFVTVTNSLRTFKHWVINYERGEFLNENYPYADHDTFTITYDRITEQEYYLATGKK